MRTALGNAKLGLCPDDRTHLREQVAELATAPGINQASNIFHRVPERLRCTEDLLGGLLIHAQSGLQDLQEVLAGTRRQIVQNVHALTLTRLDPTREARLRCRSGRAVIDKIDLR